MLPDFLIIGAPRCGTTWLKDSLRNHHDIAMPSGEVNFFDNQDNWKKGVDWYKGVFDDLGEAKLLGEKSPNYLTEPEAAVRIKETIPYVKMIAILRNPIDRAYSESKHHITGFGGGTFEEAIKHYPYLLRGGLYANHLKRFFEHFDRDQFLILKFDDLENAPRKFLKEVLDFLEVDDYLIKEVDTRPRNVSNLAPLRDKLKRLNLYWFLERIKSTSFGSKLRDFIVDNQIGKRPPMNPKTRKRLRSYYEEPNKELEDLLSWNLNWE